MEIKILVVSFIIANDFFLVKLDKLRRIHTQHSAHSTQLYNLFSFKT